MSKFCCNKFNFHYSGNKEMGLHFIVLKPSESINNISSQKKNSLKFLITQGYTELTEHTQRIFIDYCPFCGLKLDEVYKEDSFINEDHHLW